MAYSRNAQAPQQPCPQVQPAAPIVAQQPARKSRAAIVAIAIIVLVAAFAVGLLASSFRRISFEGNGARSGSMEPILTLSWFDITLPANGFERPGYSFVGWGTSTDESTQTHEPGTSVSANLCQTYYALWSNDAIVISFYGGGADGGSTDSITLDADDRFALPECGFTRSGYEFDCWVGSDGREYHPGDELSATKDSSFWAQWRALPSDPVTPPSDDDTDAPLSDDDTDTPPADSDTDTPASEDDTGIPPSGGDTDQGYEAALSFPRVWSGYFDSAYSVVAQDENIVRSIKITLTTVTSDGTLDGFCEIGIGDTGPHAAHGSYNLTGSIDWNTGAIHLEGTTWIDRRTFDYMRTFDGTVNESFDHIIGSSVLSDGSHKGTWEMNAV